MIKTLLVYVLLTGSVYSQGLPDLFNKLLNSKEISFPKLPNKIHTIQFKISTKRMSSKQKTKKKFSVVRTKRCWWKGKMYKLKYKDRIFVYNGKEGYIYKPKNKDGREINAFQLISFINNFDIFFNIRNTRGKRLKSEKLGKKKCNVYKIYRKYYGPPSRKPAVKIWVWKKNNIILKKEVKQKLFGSEIITITELSNIKINETLKDSFFEVPKDINIKKPLVPNQKPKKRGR